MSRLIQADRVRESSTTTGTGDITVAGATTGFRTFTSVLAADNLFHYCMTMGADWEVGLGRLLTSTTFARESIIASSNAGAAVSWAAGTKDVFLTRPSDHAVNQMLFGSGASGDVTISSPTTLTDNVVYDDLTVQNTLTPAGFLVCVAGVLDLSHASALITGNGNAGTNASSSTGAAGGAALADGVLGGSLVGVTGSNGGATTGGTNGTGAGSGHSAAGGSGNSGGAGASGAGGTGNLGGSKLTGTRAILSPETPTFLSSGAVTRMTGGAAGGGAAGGGGDGTAGGGGGGSGSGGRLVWIFAHTIKTSGSTVAGVIRAIGGAGGNGFSPAAGNRGGGAGAGGAGGGWVRVCCAHRIGAVVTNLVQCTGGAGGTGGTKTGTGVNGSGGGGGNGGIIQVFNITTGDSTIVAGSAGGAGGGVGVVTGGAGGACNATF